jgi:hypothetical protein
MHIRECLCTVPVSGRDCDQPCPRGVCRDDDPVLGNAGGSEDADPKRTALTHLATTPGL